MSILSNKEQIEFGDHAERLAHLLSQNKELKELVIVKENHIHQFKAQNNKLEKELQNIMDPLSKNSQLKTVLPCSNSIEVQGDSARQGHKDSRAGEGELPAEEGPERSHRQVEGGRVQA